MSNIKNANRRKSKDINPATRTFVTVQIMGIVLYSAMFLIVCAIALKMNLSASECFYAALGSVSVPCFICGFYSGYKLRKNGMLVGLLFCLPMNCITIIVSALTSGFNIDFTLAVSSIVLLIVSMLGGIASVNTRLKAKRN